MKKYPKIQSLFQRDPKTRKFTDKYSMPEFEYLTNISWRAEEKIDGTNIRVHFDGTNILFGGRTDKAIIPPHLLSTLQKIFTKEKLEKFQGLTFFGEGCGKGIQGKTGDRYNKEEPDFILFDIFFESEEESMFLRRETVEVIAEELEIRIVDSFLLKNVYEDNLTPIALVEMMKDKEKWTERINPEKIEGFVLKPFYEINNRRGNRIITKLKFKDFL